MLFVPAQHFSPFFCSQRTELGLGYGPSLPRGPGQQEEELGAPLEEGKPLGGGRREEEMQTWGLLLRPPDLALPEPNLALDFSI